jgi:hypothetical protein
MTDQDEDSWMQSTPPSPSVELSADRQWSPNNIAVQDSPLAMSRPPPTWEKAAGAVKSNVEHLTPRLRACLMCQIQKKKCDYGYPGQTKDDTRPHSKNLPCTREYSTTSSRSPKALTACTTDCQRMEEKQRGGDPSALYCFYPKPCEKANNGCGRCGLLRERQLISRPRSIWKDVKRKFRRDKTWWEKHTQHIDRRQDSDSWRNPVMGTM